MKLIDLQYTINDMSHIIVVIQDNISTIELYQGLFKDTPLCVATQDIDEIYASNDTLVIVVDEE